MEKVTTLVRETEQLTFTVVQLTGSSLLQFLLHLHSLLFSHHFFNFTLCSEMMLLDYVRQQLVASQMSERRRNDSLKITQMTANQV